MDITKISIGQKVEVHFNENADQKTVKSLDPPLLSFREALQALDRDVLDICEIQKGDRPTANELAVVDVRSVSIDWKDGKFGVVITAVRSLEFNTSPLNLNTPHKAQYSEEYALKRGTVDRIRTLMEEATKFVQGERAQLEMFEGSTNGQGEEEDAAVAA